MLLANYCIMLFISTWLFRHLEHQNLSVISGDIGRARSVQQFWNGRTERKNGTERSTVVLDDTIYIKYQLIALCSVLSGIVPTSCSVYEI